MCVSKRRFCPKKVLNNILFLNHKNLKFTETMRKQILCIASFLMLFQLNFAQTDNQQTLKSYARFDFVPGDSVIFEDNFVNENTDEIPSRWKVTTGNVEITKINNENVAGFLDGFYTGMYPRMKKYDYLPKRFTIEFDYLFKSNSKKMSEAMSNGASGNSGLLFTQQM